MMSARFKRQAEHAGTAVSALNQGAAQDDSSHLLRDLFRVTVALVAAGCGGLGDVRELAVSLGNGDLEEGTLDDFDQLRHRLPRAPLGARLAVPLAGDVMHLTQRRVVRLDLLRQVDKVHVRMHDPGERDGEGNPLAHLEADEEGARRV